MMTKRNSQETEFVIDDDSTIESLLEELKRQSADDRELRENIEALFVVLSQQPTVLGLTAYCRYVHGWKLEPHHIEWAEMLIAGERVCIVAPPDTGKSYLISAWCEWAIGLRPDRAIMIIGNTIKQARKTVASIGGVIQSSPKYRQVFPDVHPTDTWSREELYVERSGLPMGLRPEPTLAAFGIDGAYQGVHVDDLIIDDPTDQKDVTSPLTMLMQREQVTGVLYDRVKEGGNIFGILTRWADDDLAPTLEQIGITIKSYPAYRDKAESYPWDTGPFDEQHPVSLLCPAWQNWTQLEVKRNAKGNALFKLTFLNQTEGAVRGERVFPELDEKRRHVSMQVTEKAFSKVVAAHLGVDFGTTIQHQSAMVVVTRNSHEEVWVRAAWMSPRGSTVEMGKIARDWKTRFKVSQAHYDRSQGSLKDMFEQLGYSAFKGESSVALRIGALRTLLEGDRFYVDVDGEGTQKLWSQIASYRYDETSKVVEIADDLVDALLYAVYAILEPSKTGVGKPVEIRRRRGRTTDPPDPEASFDPVKASAQWQAEQSSKRGNSMTGGTGV